MAEFDEDPTQPVEAEIFDTATVRAALDELVVNFAWTQRAINGNEPVEVVQRWTDKMYDTLRARLSREQLLFAVAMLVHDDAAALAEQLAGEPSDVDIQEVSDLWTEQGYGTQT